MPWREMSPMDQRFEFVREYETELFTMTELAAQYGISRKTAYKWVERYRADRALGLRERSRRPHHSPHATAADVVEAIVAQRRRHPHWGAKKLLAVLGRQEPTAAWPARSTVCDLLKQRGMVAPGRRRHRAVALPRPPLPPITRVNEVWTTDFKGEFRTKDCVYCYPLTVRDGFSRFVLRCDGLLGPGYEATRRRFERAFADYGLPDRIRSDNGGPFAGPGLGGLSRLSLWWIRLGIVPERIAKGHPEQNGSHEQFHSVLKTATARPPAPNVRAQQQRFQRFCVEYNYERPHEALGNHPPASRYTASARPWPRRLPAVEYPGHFELRRVSPVGSIKWAGAPLFVSHVLAGESIGFEEVADGIWTLYFATLPLARFDERTRRVQPLR
jgi:putative transposase